jgi:putative transposase
VTLKVPKLRRQTFETAIIERYRRRDSSVEEALIEMYLAGVSSTGLKISLRLFGAHG